MKPVFIPPQESPLLVDRKRPVDPSQHALVVEEYKSFPLAIIVITLEYDENIENDAGQLVPLLVER